MLGNSIYKMRTTGNYPKDLLIIFRLVLMGINSHPTVSFPFKILLSIFRTRRKENKSTLIPNYKNLIHKMRHVFELLLVEKKIMHPKLYYFQKIIIRNQVSSSCKYFFFENKIIGLIELYPATISICIGRGIGVSFLLGKSQVLIFCVTVNKRKKIK